MMMKKADELRARVEAIALMRLEGKTWQKVADALCAAGVMVSTDEIRACWPRLSEGRSPAECVLACKQSRERGHAGDEILELRRQVAQLSARCAQADAEAADLRAKVSRLESEQRRWQDSVQLGEAAARWEAFGKHLVQLYGNGDLEGIKAAAAHLARRLPVAIALGPDMPMAQAAELPSSPQVSMPSAPPALVAGRAGLDTGETQDHTNRLGEGEPPVKQDEAVPPVRRKLSGFDKKWKGMGFIPPDQLR
ncbi:MAG: hypothetical protein HY055_14180 [Magnetospirillum sp.]|nr:hypothetical protein [Magnetospirillum sp.]